MGGSELFRLYRVPDAVDAQVHLAMERIWSRTFPYLDGTGFGWAFPGRITGRAWKPLSFDDRVHDCMPVEAYWASARRESRSRCVSMCRASSSSVPSTVAA